jgi:hypothetical protein
MKAGLNFFIVFTSIIIFQTKGWGQQGMWRVTPGYSVGIPVGNFSDVVDKVSPRGWSASVLYGASDQLAIGLVAGFQDFYQKYPRTVLHEEGSDISAVISNSVQVIPVMAKAKYIFSKSGTIQPFGAIAAGVNFAKYDKYYGQFVDSYSKVGFAAQPEAGIHIPVGVAKKTGIELSAAYNIMPFKYNDAENLNHVSIRAGVSIPLQR